MARASRVQSDSVLSLPIRLMAVVLSCGLQVWGWYLLSQGTGPSSPWYLQFNLGLGLSIGLTVLPLFLRHRSFRLGVSAFRIVVILLLFVPMSESIGGVKFPLLLSFFLEISLEWRFPANLLVSLAATGLIWGPLRYAIPWQFDSVREPPIEGVSLLVYSVLLLTAASLAQVFGERNRKLRGSLLTLEEAIKRLTDANTGFQQYLMVAEQHTKDDERNRIVRELHDSIGYTLTTIIMLSESGLERSKRGEHDDLEGLYKHIRDNARDGLNDVRVALRVLKRRKDRLTDINSLLKMVSAFETATAVRVNFQMGNAPDWFGEAIDRLVFRFIQEGMVNAFRHGHATKIDVHLWVDEGRLHVHLRDNGNSESEFSEGLGLGGMRERLAAVGGTTTFQNTRAGFSVEAEIPIVLQPVPLRGNQ